MAPKPTRGGRNGTQKSVVQTAASQRSSRRAANPLLEALRDDIDRVGRGASTRRSEGERAWRGSGLRPATSQRVHEQPARNDETGTSGDVGLQDGIMGQDTGVGDSGAQGTAADDSEGGDSGAQDTGAQDTDTGAQATGAQATGAQDPGTQDTQTGTAEQPVSQTASQPAAETPAQSASMTTTGAQQGGLTSETQQSSGETQAGGEESGQSKRRRSSETKQQESPKRQKTNGQNDAEGKEGTGVTGGQAQQQTRRSSRIPRPAERESCVRVQEVLNRIATDLTANTEHVYANPVTMDQQMEDEDTYRAIASVSEAVTERGVHPFSIMDPTTLQRADGANYARGSFAHVVARPREEMLVPVLGRGHISLFVLRRIENEQFRMLHFDSATRAGHRTHLAGHYAYVRDGLFAANWDGDDDLADRELITGYDRERAAAQHTGWTCGFHTVFTAWAFALDLRLSGRIGRYNEFITRGAALIRLAVRGELSSATIRDFFDCHDFIQPGQEVPEYRAFDSTIAFPHRNSLRAYVARVRIEERLPADWAPYETLLTLVQADMAFDFDVSSVSTQAFIELAREILARPENQSQGQEDGAGSTSNSHGDPSVALGNTEEEEAVLDSLHQSQTGAASGESSGQSEQTSGALGATAESPTPGSVIDNAAIAAALQEELDGGLDRITAGSLHDMQTNTVSGTEQDAAGSQNAHAEPALPQTVRLTQQMVPYCRPQPRVPLRRGKTIRRLTANKLRQCRQHQRYPTSLQKGSFQEQPIMKRNNMHLRRSESKLERKHNDTSQQRRQWLFAVPPSPLAPPTSNGQQPSAGEGR